MPANTTPLFLLNPIMTQTFVTGGNINRDGQGSFVFPLASGGSFGSRIELITIEATGTTTAGMIRLFTVNNNCPNQTGLWKEISVTAATPSATVQAFSYELVRTDGRPLLVLGSGHSIRASTHNAEWFNVIAQGGDF